MTDAKKVNTSSMLAAWVRAHGVAVAALVIPACGATAAWASDAYLDRREQTIVTQVQTYVNQRNDRGVATILEAVARVETRTESLAIGIDALRTELHTEYSSKEDQRALRERVDGLFELLIIPGLGVLP